MFLFGSSGCEDPDLFARAGGKRKKLLLPSWCCTNIRSQGQPASEAQMGFGEGLREICCWDAPGCSSATVGQGWRDWGAKGHLKLQPEVLQILALFFCGTTKKGCRHASNIRIPINSLAWGQDSGLERCIGATWTCQNHTSSHLMPGVFSNEALSKVRRLAVRHVRCHSKFDWDSTQIYNPFQFQYWKVRFAAIPFSTPILPGKNHTLTTLKWQWMKRTRRCYGIRKWLGHQRAWYELLELLFGGFIDLAMLDD